MKVDENTRKFIQELKDQEPFRGVRMPIENGRECKIRILGRGEMAFYQEGDRALLLEVLAGDGVIVKKSIRKWDTGQKVTESERDAIVEHVATLLRQLGAAKITIA